MVRAVASGEFTRQLETAEGIVELVDTSGRRLATTTRSPTNEEIRIANHRRATKNQGMTTERLVNRLNSVDEPANRVKVYRIRRI